MIFKLLILILTIEKFNCQGWNTVNQIAGQYRDNTFLNNQQFLTNNVVNQANGIYQNSIFNGKKRSARSTKNLLKSEMESGNGGILKGIRSNNIVKITNNNNDNTLRDCLVKFETINLYMKAINFGLDKNQFINDPKLADLESISQCINFITNLVGISTNYVSSMYQQPVNTHFQQPIPINQQQQQKQPNVEIGRTYTGLIFNGK